MSTITYNKNEFDIDGFLDSYENDIKRIFKSLEEEMLSDLVDIIDKEENIILQNSSSIKEGKNILDILNDKKYALFLLLGGIADEDVTYYRFIDGIQYRVNPGEIYDETISLDNFHEYETNENIISKGNINFERDMSLGIKLSFDNDNINITLVELKEEAEDIKIIDIKNAGSFSRLLSNYLDKFKNKVINIKGI